MASGFVFSAGAWRLWSRPIAVACFQQTPLPAAPHIVLKNRRAQHLKTRCHAIAAAAPAVVAAPSEVVVASYLPTLTDTLAGALQLAADVDRQYERSHQLPVPNLGYTCMNTRLSGMKPKITSGRTCRRKTFDEKGLPHISKLALQNIKDLVPMLLWNYLHNIHLFRVSSALIPWGDCGEFQLEELPDYGAICGALAEAGAVARALRQRLTAHPSHFVKLAAETEPLLLKSIANLEMHAWVFDRMGFVPSPENKLNIHVGGVYGQGNKSKTLDRFARGFERLSPSVQQRLTLENDDHPGSFSISDLLPLHDQIGVPLVFDLHHHKFCKGGLTEGEALEAAMATWPSGIRPVVHWSESKDTIRPLAHSDYIMGPMFLHGKEAELDVMIEAKAKEAALLEYRRIARL